MANAALEAGGEDAEPTPLSGAKLLLAGVALALANFVVVLDTTIANVSVPHIAGGLAISPTQGTWVITSYSVADAISVPLTGWLASRFGTVRWFIMSLIGFGFFSMMCGLSGSLSMLVIFRILQGLSGGPLMPLSQSLLLRIFPKKSAGAAMGLWAMTTVCAPVAGPILGGLISDNWTWPWIFFINIPVVALCIFAVSRLVTPFETKKAKVGMDVVGLVLLVVWVGAFQLMLDTGREHDWFSSPFVVAMAIVAAIGFPAFVIWELGEKNPIVDIKVFRHRGFAVGTIAVALGFGAFFASVVLTPLWLQSVVGYTATEAGYATAFVGVFAIVMSPIAARLIGKVDLRISVCAGITWLAVMSLLRTGWSTDSTFWALSMPQLLQGFGMPFFFIGLTALALSAVKPSETTSAAGIMSFVRTLCGAIGTAMATTAWDNASRVSRSEMVPALNGVADRMSQLEARGLSTEQARGAIDRLVDAQASTVGATHVFALAFTVFLMAAAIVWVAPKPKRGVQMGAAH
ncbi:DHA2 family efflux MFS transporter permease subunit [Sphingomonas sp. So64.6b]|uniref:DHA2 family efflux MFS transporter permease subunit n=1 Tax=Sphingomonas sp. So64.6b TaxID=2997354 RepID=UPI001602E5CC|nr:DHA2 family efflux MFS transporter permease subunit [Sphingomonas sp. So64.6b]QNA82745.1 DHA2 family efflux MFS transporter permease subunit [Sphingomonas sp. So64.6b]